MGSGFYISGSNQLWRENRWNMDCILMDVICSCMLVRIGVILVQYFMSNFCRGELWETRCNLGIMFCSVFLCVEVVKKKTVVSCFLCNFQIIICGEIGGIKFLCLRCILMSKSNGKYNESWFVLYDVDCG